MESVYSSGPQIVCRNLGTPISSDLCDLRHFFANEEAISLGQAWRESPQAALRPTVVRLARGAGELLILAELEDEEILNPLCGLNEPAYTQGDVFEIFLQPEGQQAYYEFHIGPVGQLFQLRIPSGSDFEHRREAENWLLPVPVLRRKTWVMPDEKRWVIYACIPLARIQESGRVEPGSRWRFSFSRYDYSSGQPEPVLSSSSPHTERSFHRRQEWGLLTFAPPQP